MEAVRRGERACCLLEGRAHADAVRRCARGDVLFHANNNSLQLKRIRRKDAWDEENDALYFCMNPDLLLLLGEDAQREIAVIDVSIGIGAPQVLTDNTALHERINRVRENVRAGEFDLISAEEFDCALLGWLLGFPVVYFTTNDVAGNCLSHQSLCIYTLFSAKCADGRTSGGIASFSVPESCLENALVQKALANAQLVWEKQGLSWTQRYCVMDQVSL